MAEVTGWAAAPSVALWCAFLVIGRGDSRTGTETDYVYAYSADDDAPDTACLVPDGWELLEPAEVKPTPGNPLWEPSADDLPV